MDKLKKVWAFVDGLAARYMGLPLWARLLCWAAVLVCVAFMAGCATKGVKISEEEAKACAAAAEPCTVWTMEELQRLIYKAMEEGWNLRGQQRGSI